MSKTAEDRYQSSWGIKADLIECAKQLKEKGSIVPFPLALQDVPDRFHLPEALYGRQKEVEILLNSFSRSCEGGRELMLISGYSGVGKTSLVKELHKPITLRKARFISGKYDKFKRNIPYSALVNAFRDLVLQILAEPEEVVRTYRSKLKKALGPNVQVISSVIPEIEAITGKSGPLKPLDAIQSANRFKMVFLNFIRVFCEKKHPLVVFLDDVQWADSASMKILSLAIRDPKNSYIYLICAYRDNEVVNSFHIEHMLEDFKN